MLTISTTKCCSKCGETKAIEEFPANSRVADGYSSWCRACHSKASAKSRQKSIKTTRGMAKHLIHYAGVRAKKNGGVCDIDVDWLENILIVGECMRTGIRFDLSRDEWTESVTNPYVPSLDRIDSNNPNYTVDNVDVVIWGYNRAKSDLPNDDLLVEIGNGIQETRDRKFKAMASTVLNDYANRNGEDDVI